MTSRGPSAADAAGRPEAARVSRPRREPRQARAKETVAAVLQAAAEVFGSVGLARATTNRIAERAGVSIGSLYQYFPDKAALLRALREQHHEEVHVSLDAAMEALADPRVPLGEGLRRLMGELVYMHEKDPGLHRLLGETLPDEECDEVEETERYARGVVEILRGRPEVDVRNPEIAAYVVVRTVDSLMVWATHHAPEGFDQHAFVEESARMLEGYLLGN